MDARKTSVFPLIGSSEETLTLVSELALFALLAGTTCGGAVGVVLSRDIVRGAFCLLLTLAGTAGLFFLAGNPFLGAVQLLVYVGGTMVLLIFGVMLTSPQLQPLLQVRLVEKILASAISLGLLALLIGTALITQRSWPEKEVPSGEKHLESGEKWQANALNRDVSTDVLAATLVGIPTDRGAPITGAEGAGWVPYVFVFEIISVHLLVVLIAAAYLARPRRPPLPDFLLADEPSAEHAAGSARIPDPLESKPQSKDVSPTG